MEATASIDSSSSESILHFASIGDLASLQEEAAHRIVSARDKHGSTPLHYAAGNGHIDVCCYLLTTTTHNKLVNNVDATSQNNGRTALHWAARNGFADVCRLLVVEFQAAVDFEAKGQVTPLQLAIWKCHIKAAKALVTLGANPRFVNAWGCGVAHWMGKCPEYNEYTESIRTSSSSSDHNTTTNQHDDTSTTTSSSIQERLVACCDWLFQECHIPYTDPNHHGQTPLHKAAFAGNLPVVRYLVERMGVLDEVRDNLGNNAADCAERSTTSSSSSNWETAHWLRRYASPILIQAMTELGLISTTNSATTTTTTTTTNTRNSTTNRVWWLPPPPLSEIRAAFLRIAKSCHPDRRVQETTTRTCTLPSSYNTNTNDQWNKAHDAYRLLTDWWEAPEHCNVQIRIRSRNAALMEYKQVLWHPSWHHQQQRLPTKRTNRGMTKCPSKIRDSSSSVLFKQEAAAAASQRLELLVEFETRLVRLLRTDGFRTHGLPISQLPKEYEKNWHTPVPKPRDFGCRKLIYLVQTYCPNVRVEYGEGKQQALLRLL